MYAQLDNKTYKKGRRKVSSNIGVRVARETINKHGFMTSEKSNSFWHADVIP